MLVGWSCPSQREAASDNRRMQAQDNALIGAAGEHFILYQLLSRNLIAALSPRNTHVADIVVFGPSMSVGSMVQVKTRTARQGKGWIMGAKNEDLDHPRLFYALLDVEPEVPEVLVVPSRIVADVLRREHAAWLAIPGKGGRPHRDSSARRLAPSYSHHVPGLEADGWMPIATAGPS